MGLYFFFYGKGSKNNQLGMGIFGHHRIVAAVERMDFVSDRMSYIYIYIYI
jgi:hypothetical protein